MTTTHHEIPWHVATLVGRRFIYSDTQHAARTAEVVDVFADRFGTWAVVVWDEANRRETYAAHTFTLAVAGLAGRAGVAGWMVDARPR